MVSGIRHFHVVSDVGLFLISFFSNFIYLYSMGLEIVLYLLYYVQKGEGDIITETRGRRYTT